MNPTACSQTGCSGLAPAPELCPYGAPAAATSPCRAFMNKPQPFFSTLTLISFLLNLTHTTYRALSGKAANLINTGSGAILNVQALASVCKEIALKLAAFGSEIAAACLYT